MRIEWSEEDQVFMAILPEFDNAVTHGRSYAEAAKQGRDLIESFIIWFEQDGKELPKPIVFDYDAVRGAQPAELVT